jgi:hypothetical protein
MQKVCGAVEALVEGTDNRLRGVCNYRKQLREGACQLLQHIESLVDRIPPPLLIDRDSLVCDPLVRALLSDVDTIHRLFINNRNLQQYFAAQNAAPSYETFALLFLRHEEKTILGSEIHGDIILREVCQTAFRFFAHRLVAPSPTEPAVRIELIINLFEMVVRHIKSEILQQKRCRMHPAPSQGIADYGLDINNPEVCIKVLVEQLAVPERLIQLENELVRVNDMGIKLPMKSTDPSNLLPLNEFKIGGQSAQGVKIIRYPRHGFTERNLPRRAQFSEISLDNHCLL